MSFFRNMTSENNIPFRERHCSGAVTLPERGTLIWETRLPITTKKVSNKLFNQKYRLYALNNIYLQPHYLRTDFRSWPLCRQWHFVIHLTVGGNRFSYLTWSLRLCEASPYLPIWTLLGKAPIVSPKTQENSSKSWLQEILILLVKNCERHWGWRQLGKGQKGETMLEIHSCRGFSLQWHEPWCDSVRR